MSTGMREGMATMWMRRKKHCKLTMDQHSMRRTEGVLLEIVKIGQYTSGL